MVYFQVIAGWSSQEARQAHNLKVAGSNPAPATTKSHSPMSPSGEIGEFYCHNPEPQPESPSPSPRDPEASVRLPEAPTRKTDAPNTPQKHRPSPELQALIDAWPRLPLTARNAIDQIRRAYEEGPE